jgi:hypothetical protein
LQSPSGMRAPRGANPPRYKPRVIPNRRVFEVSTATPFRVVCGMNLLSLG